MARTGKGKSKKKVKKHMPKKEKKHVEDSPDIRGIVRLADNDLDGHMKLSKALLHVKGIGHSLIRPLTLLIEKELNLKEDVKIGKLTEEQLEKVNNLLYNLDNSKLPSFLVNRREDFSSGKDMHIIMNDLLFAMRQDIERKVKSRSWQGYRHNRGKKVRGQRTKNTGRRGLTVGVVRKKEAPGKK